MEPRPLQPGLLPTFRLFIVLSAVATVLAWNQVAPALDMQAAPEIYHFSAWSMVLLLLYTFSSRIRRWRHSCWPWTAISSVISSPTFGSFGKPERTMKGRLATGGPFGAVGGAFACASPEITHDLQ